MRYFILFPLLALALCTNAQKSVSIPKFGDQIMTDSTSTIMMPVLYDTKLFDSNTKLAFFDNYYANIIFYNFIRDSTKMLFDKNVFIKSVDRYYATESAYKDFMSTSLIFYRVRNVDRNLNKKIDDEDPSILYVSDKHGDNLKQLTDETENVVGIKLYDKQNFAMIKIQQDTDGNKSFDYHDKRYYYIKLDLTTLHFGKKIEL